MASDASMKAFVIDGSEHSVQDVISRLTFISTLQAGEKVDVATLSIQGPGVIGRLYRTVLARGESRDSTLDFIRLTLGEAFDLAAAYLKREEAFNRKIGQMIISALSAAKTGIESLKVTYGDDRMYVSRITTLVGTLDAKVADLKPATLDAKVTDLKPVPS